jgi:hypothetical protein
MMEKGSRRPALGRTLALGVALLALSVLAGNVRANAQDFDWGRQPRFWPGNLVLSRSVYDNKASNITVGEALPPGCVAANVAAGSCVTAAYNGTYPYVFNNAPIDGSFGITSKIFLDQITPFGWTIDTLEVPNNLQWGITSKSDQLVTSFSSKSELGLHLSTDGNYLTFMGYVAPVNAIDVSNSNTPGAVDITNPVGENVYRAVATMDKYGEFHFTETNAYSGNNGRAAILNNTDGFDYFYTAGNAGNGSNPQPADVVLGAGAQIIDPSLEPESAQAPGLPTLVGAFSVTELGDKADKVGKDDNFRGITIFNNVLYYTKGSGGNGVNTVYFVDPATAGSPECPNGVGIPSGSDVLPSMPFSAYNPTTGTPTNMCVLAGFPTLSNKSGTPVNFPFAIWFADANTLYVADEGDGAGGSTLYTHAAAQTLAGLEKWVFNSTTQQWTLAYTLNKGLNLGVPYNVFGYPTGTNAATGLPWAPATDGLRNITGRVDQWGNVIIWAITSTVSGSGDQGADPNRLVVIEDSLANTDPAAAANDEFHTLRTAQFGEVLRGVSFTPGTDLTRPIW